MEITLKDKLLKLKPRRILIAFNCPEGPKPTIPFFWISSTRPSKALFSFYTQIKSAFRVESVWMLRP